jgi:hypothetical protein
MNKALRSAPRNRRGNAPRGAPAVLKKSRWLLLKREENLAEEQRFG